MSNKNSKKVNKISDEEQKCFLDEMLDVRALKSDNRVEKTKNKPSPKPRYKQDLTDTEINLSQQALSDPIDLRDVATDEVLFFARSGIQQKVQKKLRRGDFPIEEELDLHGYTVNEAKTAIQDFLYECKQQQIRYIRIIHGKGYRSEQKIPVLKTHVAYWLPQHPSVLAFSSAQAKDGGTGAVYVLLKK